MLTKIDIDDKIRELVKERAATNQGMFDLDDITAELAKFLAEHKHQGRSARYYVAAYDRRMRPRF